MPCCLANNAEYNNCGTVGSFVKIWLQCNILRTLQIIIFTGFSVKQDFRCWGLSLSYWKHHAWVESVTSAGKTSLAHLCPSFAIGSVRWETRSRRRASTRSSPDPARGVNCAEWLTVGITKKRWTLKKPRYTYFKVCCVKDKINALQRRYSTGCKKRHALILRKKRQTSGDGLKASHKTENGLKKRKRMWREV